MMVLFTVDMWRTKLREGGKREENLPWDVSFWLINLFWNVCEGVRTSFSLYNLLTFFFFFFLLTYNRVVCMNFIWIFHIWALSVMCECIYTSQPHNCYKTNLRKSVHYFIPLPKSALTKGHMFTILFIQLEHA